MVGFIYCLSNPAIPGLVKIGKTARDPVARAAEISASTGVPTPFEIVWSRKVADADRAEAELHVALAACRVSTRREFFRCAPDYAARRARKLKSFSAKTNPKRRIAIDIPLGSSLTIATLGVFGAAVTFDLDANTVATTTAATGLALTAIFQCLPMIKLLRA